MNFLKKIGTTIKGAVWDSWNYYDKCPICNKPIVCRENLYRLRKLIMGAFVGCGVTGAAILPLFGFGTGGISAGSFAASWQSYIGNVAAGSLFATLQSLGATGLGILLFGSVSAALGVLATIAYRLGWCTCVTDEIQQDETLYNFLGNIGKAIKETVWDSWNYYDKCPTCSKPIVCEANLNRLRKLIMGFTVTCGAAAPYLLETLLGLGAASFVIIFGADTKAALELLATIATKLNWCSCKINYKQTDKELLSIRLNADETTAVSASKVSSNGSNEQRIVEYVGKLETIEHFSNCPNCNKPTVCVPNLNKLREKVINNIPAMIGLFKKLECVEATDKGHILLWGDEDLAIRVLTSLASGLNWCICIQDFDSQKIMETLTQISKALKNESRALVLK